MTTERQQPEEASDPVFCGYIRPTGEPCRAFALIGRHFCYWHDPSTEEERATGFRCLRVQPPGHPIFPQEVPLDTPADVLALLQRVANYLVTAAQPETGRAMALTNLAAHLFRALSLRQLQEQTEALRTVKPG